MNQNICIEVFEKNLEKIKVNEVNKNISSKLDELSDKIKSLSYKLKNNLYKDKKSFEYDQLPAGHDKPVLNNTHLHFNNTLRSFW